MDQKELAGKVALVTGGASGIGEATVRALAAAGARVAVADRDSSRVEEVAASIAGATPYRLDVSVAADVEATVDAVEREVGPIALFAHVAGVFASSPVLETSDETWDKLFAVNARGVFNSLRAVGRRMKARGAGAIVTVASQSAKVVRLDQGAYGASKAAASYVTKALGLELARAGVRCNIVHPGVTDTPLSRAVWDAGRGSAASHVAGDLARYRGPLPVGRVASPEDVAAAVCFLLSDRARHVTMVDMLVDGGSTYIA